MRLTCPNCGDRDIGEFVYLGDAAPVRPERTATAHDLTTPPSVAEIDEMADYVFIRENRAGHTREHWYHQLGCRGWIEVTRNTVTHEVLSCVPASAARPSPPVQIQTHSAQRAATESATAQSASAHTNTVHTTTARSSGETGADKP